MQPIQDVNIRENASPGEIVKSDYRTALVFRKHGIDFCCGGKWPLSDLCATKELDTDLVLEELHQASRKINISSLLPFADWRIEFLTEYITNVHHYYLQNSLPAIDLQLEKFANGHREKFPFLTEVEWQFNLLKRTMLPHMKHEEEIVFPYVQQVAHAHDSKEPYAGLLVRTLRKPLEKIIHKEHDTLEKILSRLRELTNNYTIPVNACASHRVCFSLLQELDHDLVQHLYLENDILFPRAIAMEKELLQRESD